MAKKFKFRLEKVLEYRKVVKDERKKLLLEKNRVVQSLEQEQERILQAVDNSELASESLSAAEVEMLGMYKARLRDELAMNLLQLKKAEEEQEEALLHYQEAARDEEALVRLKERKQGEHIELILKEEEKFLDELGTMKGNTQYGD
ncbi:MAG: flagellar FliJ family protein [Bdellovibrionales bacterium]|nr:flagellar FliJ family protein [Bdellovibrionales bacterium]